MADSALVVAASQASVRQHVLAGLLHDLHGSLNNVGLTLALLQRTLEPWLVAHAADDAAPRVRRYLANLEQDVSRLSAWSRGTADTVLPVPPDGGATARQMLEETHRLLRHHATLAEVRLVIDATSGGEAGVAERRQAGAALLSFVVAAIALARPRACVTLATDARAGRAVMRVVVDPARPAGRLVRAFAPAPATPSSPIELHLLAGRVQVETLDGAAAMTIDAERLLLDITLPAA